MDDLTASDDEDVSGWERAIAHQMQQRIGEAISLMQLQRALEFFV